MILRSLAFLLIGFVVVINGGAQTPAPGAGGETRAFSMIFEGDGGYLGVQTEEVTRDNFGKYGLREVRGVAVESVIAGSPAEKAGLQSGDVIVRFNNDEVTSMRKLTRLLGEVPPDHQAKLTVIRNGGEREITATLAKRPMPKFEDGHFQTNMPRLERMPFPPMPGAKDLPQLESLAAGSPDQPFAWRSGSTRRIGVGIQALTKQLSEHFGVTGGVMINEVRADSPAAKAGLKAGDIIVEVDGKELKGEGDLVRAIREKKDGVSLTIVRDRNRQTVRVTPEEVREGLNTFYVSPDLPDAPVTLSRGDGISWPRRSRSLFPVLKFPARIP